MSPKPLIDISGYTSRSELVRTIHIRSADGMVASICTLGGRLLDLRMSDGTSLVLSHNTLADLESDTSYINAVVGRVANRIAKGRFSAYKGFDDIQLQLNDGQNTLHGGFLSWDRRLFSITDATDAFVEMTMTSPDGDNGFPSSVLITVRYEFTQDSQLTVSLSTKNIGNRTTVTNMTTHPYFDLTGKKGSLRNMSMSYTVRAERCDHYLVLDSANIPTGEIGKVTGTKFDLRNGRELLDGYDNFFVASMRTELDGEVRPLVQLKSPKLKDGTRIEMDVDSNQAGFQLYTGEHFNGSEKNKHAKRGCVAVEPSGFIDAGNQSHFESIRLDVSQTRRQVTRYTFRRV